MTQLPDHPLVPAQPWLKEPETVRSHASWIHGRVQVLLRHYDQPNAPIDVKEEAFNDWVDILMHLPQLDIERACMSYLRDQPRWRPKPGDILRRAEAARAKPETGKPPKAEGDRTRLSIDEQRILDEEVLPTARRWLTECPTLAQHAIKTLGYWGEEIPGTTIQRLKDEGHLPKDRGE